MYICIYTYIYIYIIPLRLHPLQLKGLIRGLTGGASVVAPLLALRSCEWFLLLSCACACDLLIF